MEELLKELIDEVRALRLELKAARVNNPVQNFLDRQAGRENNG